MNIRHKCIYNCVIFIPRCSDIVKLINNSLVGSSFDFLIISTPTQIFAFLRVANFDRAYQMSLGMLYEILLKSVSNKT